MELIQVSNGGIVIPVATVVTQSSGGGGGISGGAIAGIVMGVIGGLALIGRASTLFSSILDGQLCSRRHVFNVELNAVGLGANCLGES